MKKTELIHFHNLLGTLAKELHEDGPVTERDLSEYRALETSPMTIRGSRAEHERAVLALASALVEGIGRETSGTDVESRRSLPA
ncbi:UPF0058 family protein [Haloparvum sedimenti]|uniref:UPF0058 family protein n=1 Tax=Haloparvum sedimenti TaxID=1678448 RepID=UPI00071E86F7|nr:UPF0058 family protein [Haloparvum sedimenti]